MYVVGPVWHLVDGSVVTAPKLGLVYVLKCYRWMPASTANEYGFFRGAPAAHEPVCLNCQQIAARDLGVAERDLIGEAEI